MSAARESGAITVEYAVAAAAVILVFAAVVRLSQMDPIGRWVEKTRRAIFVSASFKGPKSLWTEIQER